MKQTWILLIVYVVIIVVVAIFLLKFTNRGYSRRVLADITRCPFGKEMYFPISTQGERSDAEGWICFSLYGKYSKYAPTLYVQLDDIRAQMPTWQAHVWTPSDVPPDVVSNILSRGAALTIMNGGESQAQASSPSAPKVGIKGHEGALWRFLGSVQTKPFITLDADDKFDPNLPGKIRKWLNSGESFFIFKPWEILLPMAAGRWGARGIPDENGTLQPPIPDMLDRMNAYCEHWFGFDEAFLKKEIWSIVRKAGVYKSAHWPVNEILLFVMVGAFIAAIITLATARDIDKELIACRSGGSKL
jgi:hypothetical protein